MIKAKMIEIRITENFYWAKVIAERENKRAIGTAQVPIQEQYACSKAVTIAQNNAINQLRR